ncbi:MAG: 2-C-methyl-D-erythritol 4-phosphate cytidylyltransferase [Ethanoligenens sp.]
MIEQAEQTVTAIIVAAGNGRRMGGIAKPFLPLCGRPVLMYALEAFTQCPLITEIVLVTRPNEMAEAERIAEGCEKMVGTVAGGSTRQLSVRAGMALASGAYLAIHDGARPLVTPACIERAVRAAFDCGASAAAVKVKDTVKVTDDWGYVMQTPERARLWAVQTPQVFRTSLLARAFDAAETAGADYTDDCQLVEAIGGKVRLVEGDYANLKITTPEDMDAATALLRKRKANA